MAGRTMFANCVTRSKEQSYLPPATSSPPDYLPDALFRNHAEPFPTVSPAASLEEIEKEHIIQVLAETPILEDAAARLDIDTSTLWRKRKRYKIEEIFLL